jgi:hypothetical protein
MGFYGNIKNTSRTQFSFDKVYASRVEMDNACPNDGVYAGRYVLVEYEQNFNVDNFPIGYLKDGVLYAGIPTTANGTTLPYRLQKSVDPDNPDYSEYPAVFVKPGTVIHVPKELNFDEDWDEVGGVKKPSSCFYVIKKVEAERADARKFSKEEMDKHAYFNRAAKVYLDAEKLMKQKDNYSHFEEIEKMYDEAKSRI